MDCMTAHGETSMAVLQKVRAAVSFAVFTGLMHCHALSIEQQLL